jgi:predicted nucleic acid-binding protein
VVVVDTSVWVAAERKPNGDDAGTLRSLLRADEVVLALPVRVELMTGVPVKDRSAVARELSSLVIARPTDETWNIVERFVPRAKDAGYHFKLPDLLIAALAQESDALIWSLDTDFATMETLGFVRLYR